MIGTSNMLYEQPPGSHACRELGVTRSALFSLNLESDGYKFRRKTWTVIADVHTVMTVKLGVTG